MLSVVFLAVICLVIAGLVKQLVPEDSGLLVPSFVFISIALWIAYDYMMVERYEKKLSCMRKKHEMSDYELEAKVNAMAHAMATDTINNKIPDVEDTPEPEPKPVKEHENEFDIDIQNKMDIRQMHSYMGGSGDTQICNRMKYMGMQAQMSQDIRAKWNKYSVQPWIEEELQDHADREWWNSDHLESEF